MKVSVAKIWAPVCALPGCLTKVNYHDRYLKEDGSFGYKWKAFCDAHRTVKKSQRDSFIKSRGGCENRDGRLGWICKDHTTPSLTIDHWDGDKYNNDESNLVVLCANCHHAKTKKFKDFKNRYVTISSKFDEFFEEV